MELWPFKRTRVEHLAPDALRDLLIGAAFEPKLRGLCKRYKRQVAGSLDVLTKVPPGTDPSAFDEYMLRLGTVARCLAEECKAPELLQALTGRPENPLFLWASWLEQLPGRIANLEYEALIREARAHVTLAREHEGSAARRYESTLLARLGEFLYHSGQVEAALEPAEAALEQFRGQDDRESVLGQLLTVMEIHRYLGDVDRALVAGDEALRLHEALGLDAGGLDGQLARLRAGEPPCRLVLVLEDEERELDAWGALPQGEYRLEYRHNRPRLHMSSTLLGRAYELAKAEQLHEAMAVYRAAAEADPRYPEPLYQVADCLMELGDYGAARELFEQVERMAPSWLFCRSQLWLARSLESGTLSEDVYRIHRALENPALAPDEAMQLAQRGIEADPGFAAFYLALGEAQRDTGETDAAIATYRAGLERVAEPDLESRMLVSLASALSTKSPEWSELVGRACALDGSLLAKAMAAMEPTH